MISNAMLVLDTDVIVAALRSSRGASAALLDRVLAGRQAIALSAAMVLEYEAVTLRSQHLTAGGISEADALRIIDALVAVAIPVKPHFRWRPQLRDPADELVLEAAVNAGAVAIVTFNRRHFVPAAARFGLDVMLPKEILEKIR